MNNKRAAIDLFLVSALSLFVELVFIRWAASEVRMLAFYKNFALIAAFLGIGLGFTYRQRSPNKQLFERYFFSLLTARARSRVRVPVTSYPLDWHSPSEP